MSLHAQSRKRQMTVTFTTNSRIVDLQYETYFKSPCSFLERGDGFYFFGKFVNSSVAGL